MRFTVAAAALAGTALANYEAEAPESTVYSTEYYTITSCGPTVTDCPAESTGVYSSSYPVTTSTIYSTNYNTVSDTESTYVETEYVPISTTVCPVEGGSTLYPSSVPASYPAGSPTGAPYPTGGNSGYPSGVPYPTGGNSGYPSEVPTYPGGGYPTGSEGPYPTETVAPACPTYSVQTISTEYTTVIPTVVYSTVEVPCPTGTGYPVPSGNGSYPTGTAPPQATVTAGAATVGGSVLMAAAAGLVAFLA